MEDATMLDNGPLFANCTFTIIPTSLPEKELQQVRRRVFPPNTSPLTCQTAGGGHFFGRRQPAPIRCLTRPHRQSGRDHTYRVGNVRLPRLPRRAGPVYTCGEAVMGRRVLKDDEGEEPSDVQPRPCAFHERCGDMLRRYPGGRQRSHRGRCARHGRAVRACPLEDGHTPDCAGRGRQQIQVGYSEEAQDTNRPSALVSLLVHPFRRR